MGFRISEQFRQSMGWFHTWLGIALSSILFAIFWTGTLTVFDKEIDQWMKPELRIPVIDDVQLDEVVLPRMNALDLQQGSAVWIGLPRERIPVVRFSYKDVDGELHREVLDPRSGDVLDLTDSEAGSEFFFDFHFMLKLPGVVGYYVVALAALGMMALLVSGVFIHRKIIQDFFTFRPQKKSRRASLDFHNLTGVVALPFHFIIPFSGLLILIGAYFPWSMAVSFDGNIKALDAQLHAYEKPKIEPAQRRGDPVTKLDAYVDRSNYMWREKEGEQTSRPDWLAIFNVNDANAYVVVERYFADRRVALGPDQIVFDPQTDEVIDQFEPLPVHSVSTWIEGLHWIQFDHWPLRWIYFFAGLSGCAMIGSGLVFWVQARIKKMKDDRVSVCVVRALSIGTITGIIAASGMFFVANRLIPKGFTLEGFHRHDLEIWSFFLAWGVSYLHAAFRGKSAWREQCLAISFIFLLAVFLNWITTGHHPVAALSGSIGAVAAMDLVMLSGSAIAFCAASRFKRGVK